jgi:hypothetical protein
MRCAAVQLTSSCPATGGRARTADPRTDPSTGRVRSLRAVARPAGDKRKCVRAKGEKDSGRVVCPPPPAGHGSPPRRPSVRWQLRPRPHPTHVPAKPYSSTKPNRVVRWWGRAGGNTCRASRPSTAPRTRKVDRLTCQWATQGRDGGYRAQEFRRAMDGFGFHDVQIEPYPVPTNVRTLSAALVLSCRFVLLRST